MKIKIILIAGIFSVFGMILNAKEIGGRVYSPGTYKDNPNDVVVNVWNWDSLWKVEWIENGQNKGEMTRYSVLYADAVALCSGDIKYHWIAPDPTDHMFKATPSDLNAKILIKVTDRFGNVFEQELKTEK